MKVAFDKSRKTSPYRVGLSPKITGSREKMDEAS